MDSRNIYKKSLKYNTAALYYNLSTSCFFCVFFILIYHNPFICNVLILVFVLEFFVYLFINRVNQCPSVSNKKQCESVSNFFGCGQRPRRDLCGKKISQCLSVLQSFNFLFFLRVFYIDLP